MRRIALVALAVGLFVPLLASAPANAQATRTWVSGVGDDANPCSRTAPCKTFAGAISKTAAAGEINCLDPGGYGGVTVTKSMTISCEAGSAGVLVSGTNAIIFNGAATDYLFLKGLDIEGLGTGLNGIRFLAGGFLHVEDCVIRRFTGNGILIEAGGTTGFEITRTTVFSNGNGATGAGIRIAPAAGGTSKGVINRVVADRNTFGIAGDASGGSVRLNIDDSTSTNSTLAGIIGVAGSGTAEVMVMRATASNNGTGIQNAGGTTNIRVGSSAIQGNTTGVSGTVSSYSTNQIDGNNTNGVTTPTALH
ncbi:right-handed parallel beta-helix repeat-containing protein [Bradyrhizobium sp. 930_D9_N1_4]|uniref:right-handed parallel beta-helix repeat-containing protein n=1 Tax=Bradyrhizobium sp. 930_D9_N1_4 TaxID=3240374 RepID=UPI003F8B9F9B